MNLHNKHIEQYIIQYFEGTLSPMEKDWLLRTIEQNPEYRELFDLYKQTYLSNQHIAYTKKDFLKKDPQQYIINEWEDRCIRYVENQLTPEEQKAFLSELESDIEKRQIFEKYQQTRLYAQANTDFTSKSKLKKDNALVNPFEELCIQSIEHIITESDKQILEKLINNDVENRKVFEQYTNTKLKPDTTIVYLNKEQLKKTPTNKTVWLYWASAAAASIIVLFFWLTQKHETQYSFQAHNHIYRQVYFRLPVSIRAEKPSNHNTTIQPNIQKTIDSAMHHIAMPEQNIAHIQAPVLDTNISLFYAQKTVAASKPDTVPYNDEVLKESLDKLFANHRYHYFHEMIDQTADINQPLYQANIGFSFWKILQKGSKYLNFTGANVKVNEYQQSNRIKKEIAIGSLYFSTTSQK